MDCTLDQVVEALNYISPDEPRLEWVMVGMSLKAEFGEAGLDLFDNWSQGSDKYKRRDVLSTWKSIKPHGGIGLGSLIKKAKDNGWRPVKIERDEKTHAAYLAELADRRAKAKRDAELSEAFHMRMANVVADGCNSLIAGLHAFHDLAPSDYLNNKQVGVFGVYVASRSVVVVINDVEESFQIITGSKSISDFFNGFDADAQPHLSVRHIKRGTVVIPLRDFERGIRSVQLVYPSGKKSFFKYGEKSGCYHGIGTLKDGANLLCFAEGYATAASIHMATGLPCVVAVDAGNLLPVAKKFRERMPGLEILFCADNDKNTKDNPGVMYATAAANEIAAAVVVPEFGAKG